MFTIHSLTVCYADCKILKQGSCVIPGNERSFIKDSTT